MDRQKLYAVVNDIVVKFGVQAGRDLISQAMHALKKTPVQVNETRGFPQKLEEYRTWFEGLDLVDSHDLLDYLYSASKLAYRWHRKQSARDFRREAWRVASV